MFQSTKVVKSMNGSPAVLATDLDGTFIPLANNDDNRRDLGTLIRELETRSMSLVFVTGRHLASIRDAMKSESLPLPNWIIGDVGTSIYHVTDQRQIIADQSYAVELARLIDGYGISRLRSELTAIPGLTAQVDEKQGPFKLSFYCDSNLIDGKTTAIQTHLQSKSAPYQLIASVDPFNGDGLLDLLPKGVSKAFAIDWWCTSQGLVAEQVMFSGDSGNDYAALTAGYRSILVGNANRNLADGIEKAHQDQGWTDRLCLAKGHATSGVLEGLRYFAKATT